MVEQYSRVVRRGKWLYDGTVEMPLEIVAQNWDYYYEDGYEESPPSLNDSGEAYYVMYGGPMPSRTCLSLAEAIKPAHELLPPPVAWDEDQST